MKRLPSISILILPLIVFGCGPSAEEQANQTAKSLTEQAGLFYESGLVAEAEDCANRAIATPGATDVKGARDLLEKIERQTYDRAWKKAEAELRPSFDEAATRLEAGEGNAAVALLEEIEKQSKGAKADCVRRFLGQIRASLDVDRAESLWMTFDLPRLYRFAETNTLPEPAWIDQWGPPLDNPACLAAWKKTLTGTLPRAVERKKTEAARTMPQSPPAVLDTNLTVPMEEVSEHPEKWYGKRMYFNNVWVRGGIKRDPEFGYTVSVLSPNGNRFPAKVTGEKMIFVLPRLTAEDLNKLVTADSKIEVKMYVKIERGKMMVLEGQRTFPKASIYWMGILADGKVRKILKWQ